MMKKKLIRGARRWRLIMNSNSINLHDYKVTDKNTLKYNDKINMTLAKLIYRLLRNLVIKN